jgi:hypothetical protein
MHLLSFFKTISISLLFLHTSVWAQLPTLEEAQKGVNQVLFARTNDATRKLKINKVLGCLPAFKQPKGTWVCPLEYESDNEVRQSSFTFKNTPQGWQAQQSDAKPACAPLAIAELAFRQTYGQPQLKVKGEVDDGEGLFTSDRGMTRNRKGPYRLMCRYEVQTISNPDALFLTYVWHDGEKYIIDADVERW